MRKSRNVEFFASALIILIAVALLPIGLPKVVLANGDNARFVSNTLPDIMSPGEVRRVSITVKNTGGTTWSESDSIRLGAGSTNQYVGCPHDNEFRWSNWQNGGYSNGLTDQRAFISGTVPLGSSTTFTFDITAPSTTGTHWFEARMVHDGVAWFGGILSKAIEVQNPTYIVTLTLYMHEGSSSGPVLSGVRVTGKDEVGNTFDKTTNTNGYVAITGLSGTWQFTAWKLGYKTKSWSQRITATSTVHAYLLKTTERVRGIDVSRWQGNIDWKRVRGAGYLFAFIKASEGVNYRDPNFVTNMRNGRAAGILVGAYHFARPDYGNDAAAEARYFVSVAKDYIKEGYLRPVLDLEVGANLGKAALSKWVNEWMSTVKSETGVEPIIYVNSNYARNYLDASITRYALWIAHWTYDSRGTPNTGIWNDWAFWQYSNKGSVPGITGNVDLDVFNGGMTEIGNFVIGRS